MQFKLTFATFALALATQTAAQCTVLCCQSVQPATSPQASQLLGLLGIVGAQGNVGITALLLLALALRLSSAVRTTALTALSLSTA
ncbi:hypothetical protein BDP27DRAFT_1334047, partial [Rhodocollybia butyracea]